MVIGVCAAILWYRLQTPRCEVAPLEQLGLDLADDEPATRLARVREVVQTLGSACEVVSFETTLAISLALQSDWYHSPPSSPNWRVVGSRRYGCLNDENWRRCIELAGYPQQLQIRSVALWTGLMFEELGVSRTAAQQLAWALSSSAALPFGGVERSSVLAPVVEVWPSAQPAEWLDATVVGVHEIVASRYSRAEVFLVDRRVTVARLAEVEIVGPVLVHVYSVALGQAFPVDAWIPLWISWKRLHCDDADCELPRVEASRIAVLREGTLTDLSSSPATSRAILLVPDAGTTWAEIMAAVVTVAPARCLANNTSPECNEPWVTIWLTSDARR
ncbi:MAG: hypothetical protein R6X02_11170 [Enhygromyxa sp.]